MQGLWRGTSRQWAPDCCSVPQDAMRTHCGCAACNMAMVTHAVARNADTHARIRAHAHAQAHAHAYEIRNRPCLQSAFGIWSSFPCTFVATLDCCRSGSPALSAMRDCWTRWWSPWRYVLQRVPHHNASVVVCSLGFCCSSWCIGAALKRRAGKSCNACCARPSTAVGSLFPMCASGVVQ